MHADKRVVGYEYAENRVYKYNLTLYRSQRSLKTHPVKVTISVTSQRQKGNHTVRDGNTLILLSLDIGLVSGMSTQGSLFRGEEATHYARCGGPT